MTPAASTAPPAREALLNTQVARAGSAAQHPLSFQRPGTNQPVAPGGTTMTNTPQPISSTSIRRAQSAQLVALMESKKNNQRAANLLPHVMPMLMGHIAKAAVAQLGNNGDGAA